MLVLRLTRVGKKNSPAYRVVVADKRKAVKRKFIEIIGHYNPTTTPKTVVINKERALYWIGTGAQPSDTVNNLMCDLGVLPMSQKIKKVYARKPKKDEGKEESAPVTAEKAEETTEEAAPAEEIVAEETAEEATPEAETAPEAPAAEETPATEPEAVENSVEE